MPVHGNMTYRSGAGHPRKSERTPSGLNSGVALCTSNSTGRLRFVRYNVIRDLGVGGCVKFDAAECGGMERMTSEPNMKVEGPAP